MPTTTTMVDWMLAKAAELEGQAAALRTAAEILAATAGERKRATVARTVGQAIAVRRAQKNGGKHAGSNGSAPAGEELSPQVKQRMAVERELVAPGESASTWQETVARRQAKAIQVVEIVRAYGKPMPIARLKEAAAAQGIDSLTGIIGYARAGYLHKTGAKGKTRYSFRQMPESADHRPA